MTSRPILKRTAILLLLVGDAGVWVTRPQPLELDALHGIKGDAEHGELIFRAAGCGSCHSAPEASGDDMFVLTGGRRFETQFGTFIAPNISPHPTAGIGNWSDIEIASAVTRGVSPNNQHYYPAFPYAAYGNADLGDVVDLIEFMRGLPESDQPSMPHEVGFPFNIRASLGGWKLLFGGSGWVLQGDLTEPQAHGRYLVEALGHCGECHTQRNVLGGLQRDRWLGGAPNPSGKGRIPNITPGALDWSENQIANYLASGFTPDFDVVGGEMVDVIENIRTLPRADIDAIAAYLKAVPPIEP